MTVQMFVKELRKAKIKFKRDGYAIRTCYGKCPIEALYRYKTHRNAGYFVAGDALGLEQKAINEIASAADVPWTHNYQLRDALEKACGVAL